MTLMHGPDDAVREQLGAWREQGLTGLPGLLDRSTEPFEIVGHGPDLVLACRNEVRGRPNRARLRITAYGEGRMAVLFYKESAVPGSGDRFSYGGLAVRAACARSCSSPSRTARVSSLE